MRFCCCLRNDQIWPCNSTRVPRASCKVSLYSTVGFALVRCQESNVLNMLWKTADFFFEGHEKFRVRKFSALLQLCGVLITRLSAQNASEKYRFERFCTARAFGSCGRLV